MKKHWWHKSRKHAALFSLVIATILTTVGFGALYVGATFVPANNTASMTGPVSLPARLVIPKIGVNAAVQSVGITARGEMGIPTNFTDVAWYNRGPKPGERGSAVIDGHLDTASVVDTDAVFARLNELKAGDEIDIVDKDGKKIRFRVADTKIYDEANAPLNKIFDQGVSTSNLNLITCDGVWNQGTRDYSKRLVVYSVRVK